MKLPFSQCLECNFCSVRLSYYIKNHNGLDMSSIKKKYIFFYLSVESEQKKTFLFFYHCLSEWNEARRIFISQLLWTGRYLAFLLFISFISYIQPKLVDKWIDKNALWCICQVKIKGLEAEIVASETSIQYRNLI